MTQTSTTRHSVSGRRTAGTLSCVLALFALGTGPASAELPSVTAVIQYTGNVAEGGNGSYPPNGNASIYYPTKAFVEGAGGDLYSSTAYGGGYSTVNNNGGAGGLFFRYNPTDGQVILDRSIDTGNLRPTQMSMASNGYLYSIEGASASQGALRRYTPGTGWEILATTPFVVRTPWVEGADGRLFNVAINLSLYAVDKDGASGVQTVATFSSSVMDSGVVFLSHSNGRLYGAGTITISSNNRPMVFSILPDGSDFQVHQTRIGDSTASTSYAGLQMTSLVEAMDGRLYGSTSRGGANNTGVLFRLDADGSNYEVLHEFGSTSANTDGYYPLSLVQGEDGHVYGTAQRGGVNSNGVIFRWNTTGEVFEPLYAFNALTSRTVMGSNTGYNPDGKYPLGLMRASDGTLYGMAQLGGTYGWGTVFKFEPGDEVPVFRFEPVVKLSGTAATIGLGYTVYFSWSSQLTANCLASSTEPGSSWTGSRDTSYSRESYTPTQLGTWTYTLTCDSTSVDFPDPVSSSYTIEVVSVDPEPESGGNGGGGAFVAGLALLPLAAAGFWRRRKRVA